MSFLIASYHNSSVGSLSKLVGIKEDFILSENKRLIYKTSFSSRSKC